MIILEIAMYCFLLGLAMGMGYFLGEMLIIAFIDFYKGFRKKKIEQGTPFDENIIYK